MKKSSFSLQSKILFSVLLIIVFFGSLATILTYFLTQNLLKAEELQNLPVTTTAQSHEILQILSFGRKAAQTLALQPSVVGFLKNIKELNKDTTLPGGISYLNAFNIGDMFSAIYLINSSGITVASTDPRFLDQNYSFRDYFISAIGGNDHLDVAYGVTSGEMGYYFSSPVKSGNQIVGVVVFKMRSNEIESALTPHKTKGLELSLVDQYGIVVYSTDPKKIFSSLGQLSDNTLAKLRQTKRYGRDNFVALDYEPVQKLIPTLAEQVVQVEINDREDKEMEELSAVRVGDFPVYLLLEASTQEIFQSAIQSSTWVALLVFGAALSAGLVISVLVRKFLRPIRTLTNFASRIGAGDYDSSLDIHTGDEMERLGLEMKKMADSLKLDRVNIEAKVNERTKELELINGFMVGRELKMVELKKRIEELEKNK